MDREFISRNLKIMHRNIRARADGEREFLFFRHPSADVYLRESELDINLIKQAKIFHFGSIILIEETCKLAQLAAMNIAKNSCNILSYDPNLKLPLWPSAEVARKGIMSIWDQEDLIKVSEDEITFLIEGGDPYDDNVVMKNLFHPNLKILIVTKGPASCRYYTKKRLREALAFVNECEALTVTERGTILALLTKQAVLEALTKHHE
ncbi:hypothetical protein GQ457_08G022980 [Hibiscus cannabinus]